MHGALVLFSNIKEYLTFDLTVLMLTLSEFAQFNNSISLMESLRFDYGK